MAAAWPGVWADPRFASPPAPPAAPRRRRPVWPLALTGLLVFGLVAGLLVWAPWKTPPPGTPTAVRAVSPKATAAVISWAAPNGGTAPDRYLVLRDGTQVASVPASKRSFTDQGLAPGSAHRYTVIAIAGPLRSGYSAVVLVKTITPSPVRLAGEQETWTTAKIRWSPSPLGPAPSRFAIEYGGKVIATVAGKDHSYDVTGLVPGMLYQYQVIARWGRTQSAPSAPLTVKTMSAPLTGGEPVKVDTVAAPGGGASPAVGDHWTDSWVFTPQCAVSRCTLKADIGSPSTGVRQIIVSLHDSGGTYSGSTIAAGSRCGSVETMDTITLSVAAKGATSDGAWKAWTGTMTLSAPYTPDGDEYCPAQGWTYSLTGSPGGAAEGSAN